MTEPMQYAVWLLERIRHPEGMVVASAQQQLQETLARHCAYHAEVFVEAIAQVLDRPCAQMYFEILECGRESIDIYLYSEQLDRAFIDRIVGHAGGRVEVSIIPNESDDQAQA